MIKTAPASLQLKEETLNLKLTYYGMLCPCPQWATKENIQQYEVCLGTKDEIPMDSVFILIEPENEKTANPFDLTYNSLEPTFTFKGRFYQHKRKWVTEDRITVNCRVFKYTACELYPQP
ncbi:MAG: hypothetical protein AAGI38_15965 [Bacteroidota bacterium]